MLERGRIACTVGLVSAIISSGANGTSQLTTTSQSFAMKEVFAWTPGLPAGGEAGAELSSDGHKIYYIHGTTIDVLEWDSKTRVTASAPFNTDACTEQKPAPIRANRGGPGELFAYWCNSLYLL